MKTIVRGNVFLVGLLISSFFLLASCVNSKKAVYFNDVKDSIMESTALDAEPVIQKSDLLSISVSSLNPEASEIFNTPNFTTSTSATSMGNFSQTTGYLVGQEGNIQFPVLGNIYAAGLTKRQLTNLITKSLSDKKLLIDPIVNVRFLNYRVTVLGEVSRPGVVNVPNEKITLLEALGLAGDLTIYARRDNVMVIREENGRKIIKRLNLNSSEIFNSPYYYLQSRDIVYAEPNKARVATSQRSEQLLPIVLSTLSFFVIVLDRLVR